MNSLKPYHDLEIDAHVTIDDALSKTTQELGELLTAITENDEPEIAKESADLLINILSVASHMGVDTENNTAEKEGHEKLPILLAEWHRSIAAQRNKYSRDTADDTVLKNITQTLISTLLPLTQLGSIEKVVDRCTEKFRSRVDAYIPKINLKDYIQAHPDFPKP